MTFQTTLFTQDIPAQGATNGHVHVTGKTSDPQDVALAGLCASAVATVLFERLHAQGTNIILTLRPDGFVADVLSRTENDGLNLQWTPKQMEPQKLDAMQERVKAAMPLPGVQPTPVRAPQPEPVVDEMPRTVAEAPLPEEEDWEVKQLLRVP